jgi:pimeloyl-ACP methyl ester carboxylesterase
MQSIERGNGRSQSFPFQTRFAHLSDGPVAYFDEGQGEPLLFIHGLVGDFTHFEHVAPTFAKSHRVAGLDLPGCGISCKPLSRHTVEGYARTVLDWMSALGMEKATLVGHSAGGMVSAMTAVLAPHRVERVVLLSPAGLRRYSRPIRFLARTVIRPRLLNATLERLAMPMLNQVFATRNEYTEKFIADALNRPTHPTLTEMAKVFHDLMPDLVSPAVLDRAREIRAPMLVVWGERDKLICRNAVDEVASVLPSTTFKKVTQCGHMPMIERPAEVIDSLRDFLQRTSSRAPLHAQQSLHRTSPQTHPSLDRALAMPSEASQEAA